MKPSTRNNLNGLIKDEVVKRFEEVVKQEILHHNLAIEKSNAQLSELKNLFELSKKELESINHTNKDSYNKVQKDFVDEVKRIENSFEEQRRFIREGLRKIDSVLETLKSEISSFVSRKEFEEHLANENQVAVEFRYKTHLSLESLEQKMWVLTQHNLNEWKKIDEQNENSFLSFRKDLEDLRSILKDNVVDAQGINRMIKIEQRSMIIIEKKIENLYTLIDRINKKITP